LLILAVILIAMIVGVGSYLQRDNQPVLSSASLPVGSYWSGSESYHATDGKLTTNLKYVSRFTVLGYDLYASTVRISYQSSILNGSILGPTFDYLIDLKTRNVTGSCSCSFLYCGEWAWIAIDPQHLHEGATVWIIRRDPFSAQYIVPFVVGASQIVRVNGADVDAWSLSYTSHSPCLAQNTCSHNDIYLYDKTYGLLVGWTRTATYTRHETNGNITQDFSDVFQVSESNIRFQSSSYFKQVYVLGGITVVIVVVAVAFLIMRKVRRFSS
jgi:hypothetical protein